MILKALQNYCFFLIYASPHSQIPKNGYFEYKTCICAIFIVILQREKMGKHIKRFDDPGRVGGSTAGFVAFG